MPMQSLFIHGFYWLQLASSQEEVERSIRVCLEKPVDEKVDDEYQVRVTFRVGVSLMRPVKMLRKNVVLCATYTPEVTRFGALYYNESTQGKWQVGKYFVVGDAQKFLAQPPEEQLLMLSFRP